MATVVRTKLSTILLAIKAQVMTVFGWPAERVLISARREEEDEPHLQADQYVRIKPLGSSPEPCWDGGGRINCQAKRRVRATLWTRLALDSPNEDQEWLTNASLGHLDTEHALFDALAGFQPSDGFENWLVTLPIEPGPANEPAGPAAKRNNDGWGKSATEFTVTYMMDLDQSRQ